ncbi:MULTISPECIES: chemotaxis protein CheB [unclassified Vibrio]|uniref:protein-glutamate O-methyltransferase n=1 Tax=Vibrio sp. HB236076 TaxID=3232307 RepID=A0AB39HF12_9VIBR|nr:chemotaxis protein CheB [Vibrio sp. HB161653]MDP5255576.1 chemotaxis protein CheB [Vibrio sp. HB161653]
MSKTPHLSVVGIGASAGGLESMRPLLNGLHKTGHIAFVVAQHMSPQHRSMLVELLAKECPLNVIEAKDGEALQPDTVYVNPPNKDILVIKNKIELKHLDRGIGPKPSVDSLFNSLANHIGGHAVGIILSGTGSDGAHGCRAIRASGGITIAQDPETAKYDGMPSAAIRSEAVDLILSPSEIAKQLTDIINSPPPKITLKEARTGKHIASFTDLINRVYQATQVDFSQYKEATLSRQLQRRIAALRLSSLEEYFNYIDDNKEELHTLQKSFLISVTAFFRDPEAFDQLTGLVEKMISRKEPRSTVRIWIPGCATGEEVYTFAIMICEQLGRRVSDFDIKIFGTDIDMAATEVARKGVYPEPLLEGLDKVLIDRYFIQDGRSFKIIKHVRDMCVFARQDLVRDPPFLKMDLISCRNLMIYLNNDLQDQIISNFHYSLLPGGYLFLGKSESIGSAATSMFGQIDKKNKIFQRLEGPQTRVHIGSFTSNITPPIAPRALTPKMVKMEAVKSCLLEAYGPPSVLINSAHEPLQFFGELGRYLSLPEGAADFNILALAPPSIRTELRALLYRAMNSDKTSNEHLVDAQLNGTPTRVNIAVRQISIEGQAERTYLVSFEEKGNDVVPALDFDQYSEDQQSHISHLENELSGTREHLQAVIEELETSNEELQSLNEELQASTEELQSSNEELETTNEELQATNEELTTVNDELQAKSIQLTEVNETLNNIQNSIDLGLIVLDEKLRLIRYTPKVVRLFGILPDDIGQKITGIPSHIKIEHFERVLMSVIQTGDPLSMEVERQGDTFLMSLAPYLNETKRISGVILTFSDISELTQTRLKIEQAEQKFRLITESLHEVVWMSYPDFSQWEYLSPTFADYSGLAPSIIYQSPEKFLESIHPDDRSNFVAHTKQPCWDIQYRMCHVDGRVSWMRDRGSKVVQNNNMPDLLVGSAVDITKSMDFSHQLQLSEEKFRSVFESSSVGIALANHKGELWDVNPAFCQWLGYDRKELAGCHFDVITHADDLEDDLHLFNELIAGKRDAYHLEKRYLTKDGKVIFGLLNVSLASHTNPFNDQEQSIVAIIQDITDQVAARQLIFEQSHFDALTQLPNRTLLKDRLDQLFKLAERESLHTSLLFVDLDGFKAINDQQGHDAGDQVLITIAQRLKGLVRASDTVARFGGDEFIIAINHQPGVQYPEMVANKVIEAIAQPIVWQQEYYQINSSIGIATYPEDAQSQEKLVQLADVTMYRAKKAGGGHCQFYSGKMNSEIKLLHSEKNELLHSLEQGLFQLYYQPIFSDNGRTIIAAESLLRRQDPDNGMQLPSDFIAVAEQYNVLKTIDLWVLEQNMAFIRQHGTHLTMVSMNVSSQALSSKRFLQTLEDNRAIAHQLCLEMTEQVISQSDPYFKTISMLHSLGYKIALDQFGLGASNFSRLPSECFDRLKIDLSITQQIETTQNQAPLVEASLHIAQAMECSVVAVGVERESQAQYFASRESVDLQGFYFAKPMPMAELVALLKSQSN